MRFASPLSARAKVASADATNNKGGNHEHFLDLSCMKCGDTDEIDIEATVWIRVTEDGTDADAGSDGHHEYTPRSMASCGSCGHTERLYAFEPKGGAA
ncbi:hypothetical protein [Lichenifustis flavocetrariae]|uniref:Uncharacterized protein n=1 Tax=Lichenifustis flavocetrariae TaxID=2949735 RepID=A0AA41Z3R7_9HYPH|nr:hypothetical protein [Lichenifustis flavocetrariae]MCW6512517.1 hypothetical protein [Lichenifustis flavocetrariae]